MVSCEHCQKLSEQMGEMVRCLDCLMKEEIIKLRHELAEAREALRLIANNGGKVTGGPDGFLNCNGVWCAEMARSALRKQESGEVKHG